MTNIVVFNAGSSSLKFSIFEKNTLDLLLSGVADSINSDPKISIKDSKANILHEKSNLKKGLDNSFAEIFQWLESNNYIDDSSCFGHRVVHGGKDFAKTTLIDAQKLAKLEELIQFAPLHQPHNLAIIKKIKQIMPNAQQFAAFDTAFHRTQDIREQTFAIPQKYTESGILRYGFHGLSYSYIAQKMQEYLPQDKRQNVVVAHLGNGASACAMKNGKSVATTMGFTPLDGLMMGTRCGNLDVGVALHLMKNHNMSVDDLSYVLNNESGLLGVSNLSSDIRTLIDAKTPDADFALDMFTIAAARQIASLLPVMGGFDEVAILLRTDPIQGF